MPGDPSFALPHRHLTSIVESLKAFDKLAPAFIQKIPCFTGWRLSSIPPKVAVQPHFETAIENLYAIGDGQGITRELMQASGNRRSGSQEILQGK